MIFKEEMQEILKSIIGEGAIKQGGSNLAYAKGDVMKYKNGSKLYLYKCKIAGNYSIPDEVNFKRIDLRG